MAEAVLQLEGITKRFGSLTANDNISLSLAAGEVVALLGENGAGKSTLMSILFGHYVADEGEIRVDGQLLAPGNPAAALAAGIGMVHQHFALAENLTVLENVILGTESLWSWRTRHDQARTKLREVSVRFGLEVDPDARVGHLSVGQRQRVEILKALYRDARILILDEPTSVLTPQESESLFEVLQQLVAQGLAIIFISHKLPEVMRVSHRVAVLRAGKLVAETATRDTSATELAAWMVGHAVEEPRRQSAQSVGLPVCELHDVCVAPRDGSGRDHLSGLNLTLRAGEITAIAGVSGNGQGALADLLCGMRSLASGTAKLKGADLPKRPADLVALGVARIPEDRQSTGVVGDLPVWQNAVAERLGSDRFSRRVGLRWILSARARSFAADLIKRFDVRGGGPDVPARALSGGNMQKLILGRALFDPDGQTPVLIVAHQPTWGLDVGAVEAVQAALRQAREAGAAVLLISDDLDEVMMMGDRIAVMHAGRLTAAQPAEQWTRASLGLAMAGTQAA